eukprot:COSAG01_NODE_8164_length_2894_cov_63.589624_4_plen_234_part_00
MDPFDPAHPQYNLNMLAATSVARLHRELVGFDKQAAPMREYLETMPYRQLRRPETVQQYVDHGGTKEDEIDLSGGGFGHWLSHHWKEIGTGIAGVALLAGQFVPGVDVVEDGALAAEAGAEAGEAGAEAGEAGADAGEAGADDDAVATKKNPYWTKARAAKFASRGKYGVLIGGPQALSEYEGNQAATPPSNPSPSGLPSGPRTDPYAASRAVNEEGQSDRSGGPSGAIDPYG